MPNTLAHLGAQTLASRAVRRSAPLDWIFLGAIVPDVPWILQRLAEPLLPEARLYDLRLYAVAQGSLALSLVLCAALAALARRPATAMGWLSLNAALHLGLDALQTKWANGVHFAAPLSWRLTNAELFWPESVVTVILTLGGLVVLALAWPLGSRAPSPWHLDARRAGVCLSLLVLYVALPLALASGAAAADNHSVATLRAVADRPGRTVEFDRVRYRPDDGGALRTFAGEWLAVRGWTHETGAVISARGRFVDAGSVELQAVHVHWPRLRDASSRLGLVGVALFLLARAWRSRHGRGSREVADDRETAR